MTVMGPLRPVYRGGRLIGFRDVNGQAVTLAGAGQIPQALAPMAYRDKTGELVISGGTPEAIQALSEMVGISKEEPVAQVSEPKERPKRKYTRRKGKAKKRG